MIERKIKIAREFMRFAALCFALAFSRGAVFSQEQTETSAIAGEWIAKNEYEQRYFRIISDDNTWIESLEGEGDHFIAGFARGTFSVVDRTITFTTTHWNVMGVVSNKPETTTATLSKDGKAFTIKDEYGILVYEKLEY